MKMLINATRSEQLRVAVVEGTTLHEYQVQIDESGLTRGNIYRGVVANVQPSLNAAFIDIGEERHGFLPVADVLESAYQVKPPKNVRRPSIDQVLKKGQPILVQVTKDGVGQKGAALTTSIALAGRYLVLTPFDSVRGISRKAEDDKDRKTIKSRLKKLSLPDDHGIIVRTNGIDQNQATLSRDLGALLRLWRKVQTESERGRGPRLLYSDQDLVVQALRDYLDPEIEQVVVDSDEVYEKAEDYMKAFMPRSKTRLVRYKDSLPLFSRYRLETQIDKIYERTAALPSGGSIVIDHTEALTAIDVNSGRATRNANHEDSIFKINCEAAEEVARQLRLRDIGGLVVVDFIDMRLRKHQARLERIMRDAMKPDKARYSVGRVSSNGLVEINRQRIKQSLRLRTHRPCPTCNGQATIPTPEFSALRLLSRIEGRAASGRVKHVTVALHPEMADMLQNHFRRELMGLESDHDIEVEIIAASTLRRTEERLDWVERSEDEAKALAKAQKREPVFSSTDLSAESRRSSRSERRRDDADPPPRPPRDRDDQKTSSRRPTQSRPADEGSEGRDEESVKTTSRRRRSRRRGGDEAPAKEPQIQAVAPDHDATGDDEEATTQRRRRSRGGRGGRGRRSRRGPEDAAPEQATTPVAETTAEAKTGDGNGDQASTATRKRRRRSRSRGRGSDQPAAETGSRAAADEAPTESRDADDPGAADSPKVVRSRRRRSRNAADKAAETMSTETAKDASSSESTDRDDEPARRTRSRSSSRRASVKSEEPTPVPAQRSKAESRSAAETQPSRDARGSSDGGGEGETTRRRRSRSRSRSRSADGAESAAAEPEAKPERGGRSARSEAKAQTSSNGGGADKPRATEPPAVPEKPPAPVGVLAGQGVEPKPKKRRWAWWGGPSDPAPDPNQTDS